MKMEKKKNLDS